jgi:hypothetical protein
MINTAYAIAVAAIAAALFVAFPSLSPQVGAVAPIAGAKGDRADIRPLGIELRREGVALFRCSMHARWTHSAGSAA